jgi:hypothetical protein
MATPYHRRYTTKCQFALVFYERPVATRTVVVVASVGDDPFHTQLGRVDR